MKKSKEQFVYICKMIFSLKHLYKGFFRNKEINYDKKNLIFDWIDELSTVMETEEYEKFLSSLITLTQFDNYLLIEYDNKLIENKTPLCKPYSTSVKINKLILDLKEEKIVNSHFNNFLEVLL